MAAPKKIDYERIEPDWRAGLKSPAQLAAEYTEATGVSVTHAAIIKHFKKLGVPRDLAAKIKAKADSMVMEAMVTGKVSSVTTVTDAKIIDTNAETVANVKMAQRFDISRSRKLAIKLLDELEDVTDSRELFEQLGELMRQDDERGQDKRNELYSKIISLPGRSKVMKELAETLKTLVTLERQAYDLDTKEGEGSSPTDREMSDNEVARRIAFALAKGLRT